MRRIFGALILFLIIAQAYGLEFEEIKNSLKSQSYPRSNNSLIIENDLIYNLNKQRLEIFRKHSESIELINEIDIGGELTNLLKYKNKLYITESSPDNKIYIFKIFDFKTIVPHDTIILNGCYVNFIFNDYLFVNELIKNNKWRTIISDTENGTFLDTLDLPENDYPLRILNSNNLYAVTYNEIFLYNFHDGELVLYGKHKLKRLSFPFHLGLLNDSLLIFSSAHSGLLCFNINNPYRWQEIAKTDNPITKFSIFNKDKIIANPSENKIVLYDFENYNSFRPVDSIKLNKVQIGTFESSNADVLFTDVKGRLFYYKLKEKTFDPVDEYGTYGTFKDIIVNEKEIFIQTTFKGILHAGLENDNLNITPSVNDYLKNSKFFKDYPNHFYVYQQNDDNGFSQINVFSKENRNNQNLCFNNLPRNTILFKGKYLIYALHGKLLLTSLNRDVVYKELLNLEHGKTQVIEIYAYRNNIYLRDNNNITVYSFNEQDLSLNHLSQFNCYISGISEILFYNNYLIISSEVQGSGCDFYNISDLKNIELVNSISYSGKISIDPVNNILFIGSQKCHAIDISAIDQVNLPVLYELPVLSNIERLVSKSINNYNYLFILGEANLNVYKYFD